MIFPHPFEADEDGLLAFGGNLSPKTLLTAYKWGIFPWYSEPPIMWWFTQPRCILIPNKIKISKSMRPYFNKKKFSITADTCFSEVMRQCAALNRANQDSTWICDDMVEGYTRLHELGYAHSIEVWQQNELVGGLYGLAIGKIFYGESMFSKQSNASKFALISLCQYLEREKYVLIDCQQATDHIMSMGAETISKESFLAILKTNLLEKEQQGTWEKIGMQQKRNAFNTL